MKKFAHILFFIFTMSACTAEKGADYSTRAQLCQEIHFAQISETTGIPDIDYDCMVGSSVPDINSTLINGLTIDENYFKGKQTLLNFWGPRCKPCIKELPLFHHIVEEVGSDKMNFLAITTSSLDEAEKMIQKFPPEFEHIVDARTLVRDTFQMYFSYPYTLHIDENGIIRKTTGYLPEFSSDKGNLTLDFVNYLRKSLD